MACRGVTKIYCGFESANDIETDIWDMINEIVPTGEWAGDLTVTISYKPEPKL